MRRRWQQKMNNKILRVIFACVGVLALGLGCGAESQDVNNLNSTESVVVILGNEPLDQETATVDTIARVMKAVEFKKENPNALLIFTGGKTVGSVSEARMMADIAISHGILPKSIRLEENARTTYENAQLTAEMIRKINPGRIFIVTKSDHIEWALPIFRKIDVFKTAEPLACKVSRTDSIAQMEEYLKTHDNARVFKRLQQLRAGIKGTD